LFCLTNYITVNREEERIARVKKAAIEAIPEELLEKALLVCLLISAKPKLLLFSHSFVTFSLHSQLHLYFLDLFLCKGPQWFGFAHQKLQKSYYFF
tara:strand:+ start:152 stop:439 length:288 start_codon:yes stop_codon:yes gene_type:complete